MNNAEKEIYLELLRASLWERDVDTSVFKGKWSWMAILNSLSRHDLLGVVANAVLILPEEFKPSMQEIGLVYNYLGSMMQSHVVLNTRLAEILPRLKDVGCKPILLKGQGLSVLYPKTCVRACGDLDIYVGNKMIMQAKKVITSTATPAEKAEAKDSLHHYHINVGGIIYELHHMIGKPGNKDYANEFKYIVNQHLNDCKNENVSLPLNAENNVDVDVLSLDFNVWYIFNHLVVHILNCGIGMRQFCDWMMVIRAFNDKSETSKFADSQSSEYRLEKTLKAIGLLRAWQILGGILVYQLGLPKNEFPLFNECMAKKSQGFLVDEILQSNRFRFASLEKLQGASRKSFKYFIDRIREYYYGARTRYVISPWAPYKCFARFLYGGFLHTLHLLFGRR